MNPILASFCAVAEFWNALNLDDTTIGIADTERFLAYYPGKTFTLGLQAGDPIRPGGITHRVIMSGQREMDYIPKEVFGVATVGIGIPILEDGRVIGCISTAYTRERQEKLFMAAEQLSASTQEMSATSEQLNASAVQVSDLAEQIGGQANQLLHSIAEISQITSVVKKISEKTQILGINANIEAHHLGDKGRAFGVVASEIGKLATETASSSKSIEGMLRDISKSMQTVSQNIGSISSATADQLTGVANLSQMASSIAEETERLHQLAQLEEEFEA